jgi:hypothetical protein
MPGIEHGSNGMDRSPSHNGLIMGQNGYTITRMRGRIHDEWFQKNEVGEIVQENTRAIVPDPLPRVKSRGENI